MLNLFVLPFLVTPCLVVAVQPCMERIRIKKKKKKAWFIKPSQSCYLQESELSSKVKTKYKKRLIKTEDSSSISNKVISLIASHILSSPAQ